MYSFSFDPYLLPVESDAALFAVDREFADAESGALPSLPVRSVQRRLPPQDDPDAREQLGHAEGLREIVVRARVERLNLLPVVSACGDDQNGELRDLTQLSDDVHAVHIRQPEIEHEDVRVVRGTEHQSLAAVFSFEALVVLRLKRDAEKVSYRFFVVSDQDQRLHELSSSFAGMLNKTEVPCGSTLRTKMCPPCASTMALHSARPSPKPCLAVPGRVPRE